MLSAAVAQAAEAMVLVDPDYRFRYVNPAFERLFGYALAEIEGQSLDLLLPEGEAAAANAIVHGAFEGERLRRAKDGRAVPVLLKVAPIVEADGRLVGHVGTMTDIRALKAAEAAQADSLGFARQLIAAIPNPLFYKDRDGRYLGCNAAFERYLGKRRDEIVGRTAYDIAPRELADRYTVADNALFERPGTQVYEASVRWADGSLRDVMFHKATFELADGSLGGLVGIILDITDLKRAEEGRRLAASVFTSTQEGIVITDAEARILDVNAAFTRITGFARDEVVGMNPRMLKSGHQDRDYYAAMWTALRQTGHWSGEVWNRRKDGKVYAELLTISAVPDEAGGVGHYVGVFADITPLKEHERELERIAHFDALTGIPNRVLLGDRMQQAVAQTRRAGGLMAVCYLDLDGFKPVNDQFGHEAGDRLLVETARRMKDCVRGGDTVARIGGDEFVLLLLNLDRVEECEAALERILAAVARPIPIGGRSVGVTASLGVTLFPLDDADADTLLRHADQAMYLAKQGGRNAYHFFDPAREQEARTYRDMLKHIEEGLTRDEFTLHYQPKVNMRLGRVVGVEALIRWRHPERGLLLPGEFLPFVEGTDLSIAIGDWVIAGALAQLGAWQRAGLDFTVSVNIAPRHLLAGDFVVALRRHLAAHGDAPPQRLELEVLETAALEDNRHVAGIIQECRQLGVSFALDDFGTGYSSLTYLKTLPAQTLKIDQSFVRDMLTDANDLAIVEGVIGLTEVFRRQVIAEGVETVEHGTLLLNLGCELAQGFGIARPMPAAAVAEWIRTWKPDPAWGAADSVRWPRDDLPLVIAESNHRAWVEEVAGYVEGRQAEAPELDHRECRFGGWYGGGGQRRYGHSAEFAAIGVLHERTHALGMELVRLTDRGEREAARARLPELFALRDDLLELLHRLMAAAMSS